MPRTIGFPVLRGPIPSDRSFVRTLEKNIAKALASHKKNMCFFLSDYFNYVCHRKEKLSLPCQLHHKYDHSLLRTSD